MTGKRAINLARVSTKEQGKLYSLDFQIAQMREYCEDVGLTVVAEFKDDASGRKLERDGLELACQMLEQNEADVLVTYKFDRLHRNYVNSVLLRDRIRKAGKTIHYAQTRTISGKTARERLPEDLQFIMAEIDADTIRENTTGGKLRKAQAGKWIGTNKPPYGYAKLGAGKTAELIIHEDEARIVRDIFSWYAYEGLSTLDIAERLTTLGIPTPSENNVRTQTTKKRGHAEWARSSVHKIIRQTAYVGAFVQFKYKRINGQVRLNPNKDEWIIVACPPIVDADTFTHATHKMDSGKKYSDRGAKFDYLVGRRIACTCGYKMRSASTGKAYLSKKNIIENYAYHFYRCPATLKGTQTMHRCSMPPLYVEMVDSRVWEWVKSDIANPRVLERKLREIQNDQGEGSKGKVAQLETLRSHKATIEDELRRLAGLVLKGMPQRVIEDMVAEQGAKLAKVDEEIARLEAEVATPLTNDTIDSLLLFSMDIQQRLEGLNDDFQGRRVVIESLDVNVTAFRRNDAVWLRLTSLLRPKGEELPLSRTENTSS